MLVISQQIGTPDETVILTVPPSVVPTEITVKLLEVRKAGRARLAYKAPKEVKILRASLVEKKDESQPS